MKNVDVAISAYGKPNMTAVAIFSLLKYSEKHINKIFLIVEKQQPPNTDFGFLKEILKDKIEVYVPRYYLGLNRSKPYLWWNSTYRNSIRYQYAFEKSNAKYLFLSHNDMLYSGDLVADYKVAMSEQTAGVGMIGQCWNCPAFSANLCNGDRYQTFKPNEEEFWKLCKAQNPPRLNAYKQYVKEHVWPLPECRLNEFAALINLQTIKQKHKYGYVKTPFGNMDLDIGSTWFNELNNSGFSFVNKPFDHVAKHVWTGKEGEPNSGLDTQKTPHLYDRAESMALEKLKKEYGF